MVGESTGQAQLVECRWPQVVDEAADVTQGALQVSLGPVGDLAAGLVSRFHPATKRVDLQRRRCEHRADRIEHLHV